MNVNPKTTIGSVVASDYRTAGIFSASNIDFCCKGNRTIEEVCESKNLDSGELIGKLNKVMSATDNGTPDFSSWPADLLIDYIEKKHHRYVESTIPVLNAYLGKIAAVHGENHPELHEVYEQFTKSAGALAVHMKKEEMILFPFIKKMFSALELHKPVSHSSFDAVEDPIRAMHQDHDQEGERFRRISYLTHNYTPPQDACATYKVAFRMLEDFEKDLHLHIHLENNILFPMALEMEKKMYHEPTH